ncbi:conserved hypothetical protein [Brevundimonas subvibrioides ATCC 15264]|uniref:Class I SAM-dependent methyltransferase n=1 Tax=Brevundimonas subvibrioides (strain ATCC 15264 / DSM 4735 / LMG 14903 / NBRC 16000 / CB 81) TaxID=633149 RepID=D9QF59_BRESC|nr:conserved hypothetical protein [Brevundimonas subvibrioides ATCC 15264]
MSPAKPASLFDGSDEMFRREASRSRVYGEYGMGASSRWVLSNTDALVLAVDTSEEWVLSVRSAFADEPRLRAQWVDVGPVGEWGRPVSMAKRDAFPSYLSSIWDHAEQPDLVLVDGRFRVASFLTSLLRAKPGTRIIFDDYMNRPHYHVADEVLPSIEHCGRQALFVVPEWIDRPVIDRLRDRFIFVID